MTTIGMIDGVRVACPDDGRGMTPFVLVEQQDWFEDEIRFVRALVGADTVMIDIGANFGLYTLAAARRATGGRIWAYEPCRATADWLEQSLAANGFAQVTLRRCALSDGAGTGRLRIAASPELNALEAGDGAGDFEEVELTTLDAERAAQDWGRVDFVKIDAEGHEPRVVDGGRRFFTEDSPLVMCEVKAGANVDLAAAERLIALGYRPYRLVPGLGALAPQDLAAPMDPYQLNLFLCKDDRAQTLHAAGRLARGDGRTDGSGHGGDDDASGVGGREAGADDAGAGGGAGLAAPGDWAALLDSLPHSVRGRAPWRANAADPVDGREEYERVLGLYARARDATLDINLRHAALREAFTALKGFIERKLTAPRLLSYARIASDYGERGQAVNALAFIAKAGNQLSEGELMREPWLPPSATFDAIELTGGLREWALAATLEAWERLRAFSSFFSDPNMTVTLTDRITALGYSTPEMSRRAALARRRLK